MTYDPTTIAREASEQLVVSFSVVAGRDLSPAIPEISKIILTAAARMVAESGAREALENLMTDYRNVAISQLKWRGYSDDVARSLMHEDAEVFNRSHAALANLAKLEGRG